MSQYSFLDCNYFNKDELNKKNIYNKVTESSLEDVSKHTQNYILDPDISIVKIKDIEKGS